ncbi:MAG: helix-turn-helix transcriptional regulator [Clostridia bacterium]|nr:helix-turn-helix transcriptional regulator [Clostridia bacterium]
MKDIKARVAKNLGALRRQCGFTQADVAEKLNYSDKAISRWEKGDTLPDINVLYEICQFYGVTMNDLVGEEEARAKEENITEKDARAYNAWLCAIAGVSVWLVATVLYFIHNTITDNLSPLWIIFVWAVPVSCIVILLFGRPIFHWVANFVLSSVVAWTLLGSIYLNLVFFTTIPNAYTFWPIFFIGIPVQAILFLAHKLSKYKHVRARRLIKQILDEDEVNDN